MTKKDLETRIRNLEERVRELDNRKICLPLYGWKKPEGQYLWGYSIRDYGYHSMFITEFLNLLVDYLEIQYQKTESPEKLVKRPDKKEE
jgi:hypothetical protein